MIVTLKEVKNYLRIDYDDDNRLLYQLIDTAQKLCAEIVRSEDLSVLEKDKKTYKTAVLYLQQGEWYKRQDRKRL